MWKTCGVTSMFPIKVRFQTPPGSRESFKSYQYMVMIKVDFPYKEIAGEQWKICIIPHFYICMSSFIQVPTDCLLHAKTSYVLKMK